MSVQLHAAAALPQGKELVWMLWRREKTVAPAENWTKSAETPIP
jgi:hypothetical protein